MCAPVSTKTMRVRRRVFVCGFSLSFFVCACVDERREERDGIGMCALVSSLRWADLVVCGDAEFCSQSFLPLRV